MMNVHLLTQYNKFIVLMNRSIATSTRNYLNQTWRKGRGLPLNPNAYGPLTDLPDYSYADGRPVPLGLNQKRRMLKQQEIAQKIITLSKEMDFAIDRHEAALRSKEEETRAILDNKLKPKGHLLLKESDKL